MVESFGQLTKERNVYYYNSAIEIKDYKISAIDVFGTLTL